MTQHATGLFCWTQLGTRDPEGAKKFYSALFGWSTEDTPIGGQSYTLLKKNGKDVGGLYPQPKDVSAKGVDATSWLSFVAVENADQITTKVRQNGGKVLMEPSDVMDHGRQAMLQDPTGAIFGVWQAGKQIGAEIMNEPGSMIWNELITTDSAKGGSFYKQVFGWTDKQMPMKTPMGGAYTVFEKDGTGFAGMIQATPEMKLTHPYWLVYFAVDDVDKSVAKAEQLGGKSQLKPTDIPEVGRISVLTDPQDGWFAIIKPQPMQK